jgi:two-component system, cell cycle sensor histidine kinase and response regulator CckA
VRRMTTAMLEKMGYTVLAADNPLHAVTLCEQKDSVIDLLLTDVVMPRMSGMDLKAQVQAVRPDIKVLFMSGYTSDVMLHHGVMEAGMQFIQKPFTRHDLARKVREVVRGA